MRDAHRADGMAKPLTVLRRSMIAAMALIAFAPARAAIVIGVTPSSPLMDERLNISVTGLRADAPVALIARSLASDGLWWRSETMFRSDSRGAINLNSQAPLSGSYRGTDAMGLFWSMSPDAAPKNADHAFFEIADFARPVTTIFEVRDGNGIVARMSLERRFARPGVRSITVRDGILGTLYEPGDSAAHPGVLVLGGSEGGYGQPDVAMLFASHGFAALSLAYFGEMGLPATLENVPMEYFAKAIRWMRNRPDIDPGSIAIYGASRGTEPALYTAATVPGVSAVVARSPSFVLWGGVSASHLPGDAAWTANGKPLPYIANTLYPDFILTYLWDRLSQTPIRQTPLFIEDMARFGDAASIAIPVEKIHGPVLLLAGKDDQIWPSPVFVDRILARLRRFGHPYDDRASSMTASGIRSHTPIFPRAGINRSFLLRSAERRRDGPGRRPRRGRRYCDFSPMPRRTGTEPLRPLFVCDGLNHLLRATPIGCIADGAAPHPVQLRPGRNVVIGERTVVWTVLKRRSVGQRG